MGATATPPPAATPPPVAAPRWARPVFGLVPVLGLFSGTCMCTCGHLGWEVAALAGACAAFTWAWSLHGRVLLRAPLAVLPLPVVAKAVADGLYFGHDHLLSGPPPLLLVEPALALFGTLLLAYAATVVAVLRAREAAPPGGVAPPGDVADARRAPADAPRRAPAP